MSRQLNMQNPDLVFKRVLTVSSMRATGYGAMWSKAGHQIMVQEKISRLTSSRVVAPGQMRTAWESLPPGSRLTYIISYVRQEGVLCVSGGFFNYL